MEGVLIALISGFFSLAAVWLNYYLKERKSNISPPQPDQPVQKPATNRTHPTQKATPRKVPENKQLGEIVFSKMPSWWFVITIMIMVSIGAALFAQWIINYGLGVFNVSSPEVEFSWLVLGLGGLAWGIAYVIAGTSDADNVVDCLFGFFIPYDDLFDPMDLGDFLRSLLSALPVNFLISWGGAIGLGIMAQTQFNAELSGVVYLVFGFVVFFSIVWFLFDI